MKVLWAAIVVQQHLCNYGFIQHSWLWRGSLWTLIPSCIWWIFLIQTLLGT